MSLSMRIVVLYSSQLRIPIVQADDGAMICFLNALAAGEVNAIAIVSSEIDGSRSVSVIPFQPRIDDGCDGCSTSFSPDCISL